MSPLSFLVLRYVAFALFICFSSVICIVAALNLGSVAPHTARFPEVDSYLIFLGAFGLVVVFPAIFVELVRKNAFITRVAVEVGWVALLWVMHLSGAAAITAIVPEMTCSATGQPKSVDCTSARILLAFTWLSTITLLSYLLGLLICSVHHHNEDSKVWRSGVRDYPWFTRRSVDTPDANASFSSHGMLIDAQERKAAPTPTMYARQIGLVGSYVAEPLRIEETAHRPIPPVPAAPPALRIVTQSSVRRAPPPPPIVTLESSANSLSLYPQHLQATVGNLPALPGRVSGNSPPPAGQWPRSRPQEPLPRKQRSLPPTASSLSYDNPHAPQEMAQQGSQVISTSAARSKPSGPRTPSSAQRARPPPLDLSRATSFPEAR